MKRGLLVVFIAVGVLLLLIALLPLFISADSFLPLLQQQLSASLGRKVTVGSLSVNLFEGGLTAKNLAIADDPAFSTGPFLKAAQLRVGVALGPFIFHKQLHITKLELVEPDIQLLQAQNGRWNYSSLGAGAAQSNPSQATNNSQTDTLSVDSLTLVNGKATVGTLPAVAPPRIYSSIDVSVSHFSIASQFPLKLTADLPADGRVQLSGTAGPIDATDTALTHFQLGLNIQNLDPVAAGFLDQQAGISGLVDVVAQLTSDGVTLTSKGKVVGNHMRFSAQGTPAPSPIQVDYGTTYNLASSIGNISGATISSGPLKTNLSGTYQLLPGHPQVQLKFDGNNLPVDPLQTLLPAFGVKLPNGSLLQGGVFTASLAIDGPVSNLVITGPVSLSGTRLSGFNLGSKLSAISALNRLGGGTGNVTEIQTFKTDLRDTQQALDATNILAIVPALGQATGNGTVQAGGQLNFNMLVKLSAKGGLGAVATGVMSALPGVFGNKVASDGIPLKIGGTTSNPTFKLDASVFGSPSNSRSAQQPAARANPLGNALKGILGPH